MSKFSFSWIANARSASKPKLLETTFEQFVETLREPTQREKKDGPAIVLATFGDKSNRSGNLRWDGNVTGITGWAIDLDKGISEEEIRKRLEGIEYVAHTTFSHTPELEKWRVIIPFLHAVDAKLAKKLFDYFNSLFDGQLDRACRNPSRLYYLPACPPTRREHYRWFHVSGPRFDPHLRLDGAGASATGKRFDISVALKGVPEGQRDDQLFRLACRLRSAGVPIERAEQTVLIAASRCTPPFEPEEAKKKLANAYRYARTAMLTDLANSRRLVQRHQGLIRFVFKLKKWVFWDGMRWQFDEDGHVSRLAREAIMSMYGEVAANPDSADELIKHAKQSQQAPRLEAMERLARSEDGVPLSTNELDAEMWLLGTPRGVLDLRTGNLQEPRPQDYITKSTNAEFDPNAPCDLWFQFLKKIMGGNEGMVGFLRRAVGYTLTGSVNEQCLFFLYGSGANGKSTFLKVLHYVLGDYAIQSPADTLVTRRDRGVPNDIARMRGARLVVTSEVEEDTFLAESLVKQLTGGDTLAARFLFAEFFEFTPTFKIFLAANHKPRIHGDDYAIWRRIRLVPFLIEIPPAQQDPTLADKLCAEAPGILAWAVKGCLEWQKSGLQPPEEVMSATEAYRSEMDTFNQWLEERCELSQNGSPPRETPAAILYDDYVVWSKANGLHPVSAVRFAARLGNKGIHKERRKSGIFYKGISLVVPAESEM